MMKKIKNFLLFIVALSALFFVSLTTKVAVADGLQITLSNSPPCVNNIGVNCSSLNQTTLEGYIQSLYTFALVAGGILAVGMIIWGSILISVSGSVDKSREGRDFITSALLGLALLFGAYLILKTVNPSLTVLTPPTAPPVTLQAPSFTGASTPASYALQFSQYCNPVGQPTEITNQSQDQNFKTLSNAGIVFWSLGRCSNMCEEGCTSVAFLPSSAITFLTNLEQSVKGLPGCGNYQITVTGGTEVGHVTHRPGNPVFDLEDSSQSDNSCLVSYLKNNKSGIAEICTDSAHQPGLQYNCGTYTETESHIHVQLQGATASW